MDNAPWFDARICSTSRRIRLADIDGSGTTDIIYLAPRRRPPLLQPVRQQLERSRTRLTAFPHVDNLVRGHGGRSARQRHRLPGLVVAACPATRGGRCATST